jgi:hypothetical protein
VDQGEACHVKWQELEDWGVAGGQRDHPDEVAIPTHATSLPLMPALATAIRTVCIPYPGVSFLKERE